MKCLIRIALIALSVSLAHAAIPRDAIHLTAATTPGGGPAITGLWTNPTQYTDGSALNPADITQTRLEYGTCLNPTTMGTVTASVIASGSIQTLTFPVPSYGTWCVRFYTTAKAQESSPSNVVSVTLQAPPNPPSNPQLQQFVTVTSLAYVPVLGNDRLTFLIVGSLPVGTACDVSQPDGPFFVVPRSAVTSWDGPVRPTTVVGACAQSVPGT